MFKRSFDKYARIVERTDFLCYNLTGLKKPLMFRYFVQLVALEVPFFVLSPLP